VHLTTGIDSHTNWKNAPRTSRRQQDLDQELRARLQVRLPGPQYAWQKFPATGDYAPVLELVYNRRPTVDSKSLDLSPEGKCTTTEPYVRMGSGNLTFTARASDKDKNLDYLDFDLRAKGKWDTTGDPLGSTGKMSVGGDKDTALRTTGGFATSKLTSGTVHSRRVRAVDDANSSSFYTPATTPRTPTGAPRSSARPGRPSTSSTSHHATRPTRRATSRATNCPT
jgi:hypothetical protein